MSESAPGAQVEHAYRVLLRRSLVAGGAALVVCAAVAAVLAGGTGLVSALLGGAVVLVFFGARLLVMKRTARSNPQLVLVVALSVYTVKIVLLGLAMVLLTRVAWVDGQALGLTVVVTAVVWLAAEMHAFTRLRVPVFGGSGTPGAPGASGER